MTSRSSIQTGNAAIDAKRGWFVGHFIDEQFGLRHTDAVELKWGVHPIGDGRSEWSTDPRTTICVLVSGRFEIMFRNQSIVLAKPGDFVMWGEGDDHKSRALEESVVLTVRWPSVEM